MPAGLTSRWGWYWVRGFPDPGRAPKCKTQNSGLRSKEEKPRDPINQPSGCNTQEGLLSVAQTGDSDLLGGIAPLNCFLSSMLLVFKTRFWKSNRFTVRPGYRCLKKEKRRSSIWQVYVKLRSLAQVILRN